MPHKLAGILLCLVLANVVNYFANQWLDTRIPGWLPPTLSYDGSSLTSSVAHAAADTGAFVQPAGPGLDAIVPAYYRYLSDGGGENWLAWREAYDLNYGRVVATSSDTDGQAWRAQLLTFLDRTAIAKYGSLLLLAITLLLFFGNRLREQYWWTGPYYMLLVAATAALYTGFTAPLYIGLVGGGFALYAAGLRLVLPLYNFEWVKTLRPFLTPLFFLLAMMSLRGPEWLDYLFWTSDLYRLTWISLFLLALFFHWFLLDKYLKNAELNDPAVRITAYGMPLGMVAIGLGLTLGFFRAQGEGSLVALNRELLLLSPEMVADFDVSRVFILFFAGVVLLILGGIGYFIQRIAK